MKKKRILRNFHKFHAACQTFLVTTVYDTIDIVLRFREFRTKNGQKK